MNGNLPKDPINPGQPGGLEPTPIDVVEVAPLAGSEPATEQITPDPNEGRWDEQKAVTLGAVAKQDGGGSLDRSLAAIQDTRDNGDHFVAMRTEREQSDVADLQENLARAEIKLRKENLDYRDRENLVADIEYAKSILPKREERLEAHRSEARAELDSTIESHLEGVKERLDESLSPFEELYDLNPEKFADMPTSDFIPLGKELQNFNYELSDQNEHVELATEWATHTEELIADGLELTPQTVYSRFEKLVSIVWGKPAGTEFRDFLEGEQARELDPIYAGGFDKTPRQKMTAIKEVFDRYLTKITEQRDAVQAKRTALLDKHKPTTTPASPDQPSV